MKKKEETVGNVYTVNTVGKGTETETGTTGETGTGATEEKKEETGSGKEIETPEGKTTIDEKVTIECKIITYAAMSEISDEISKEIAKINPDRVVICDSDEMNTLYTYKTYREQIKILIGQYEKIVTKELVVTTALVEAIALLESLTSIASFFKIDTEIKGVEVAIDKDSLIAEVVRALKSKNVTAIYPAFKTTESSEFLYELSNLKLIADKKTEENPDNAKLKDLNNQYSNLLKTLTTIDEKTGINTLEKVLKGEILDSIINNKDMDNKDTITYMLYLKAVAAGGNNNIKKNILWSELSHSGGSIITYFLINKEGDIIASKNYYNLLGPYKFKNSKKEMPKNNFNNNLIT